MRLTRFVLTPMATVVVTILIARETQADATTMAVDPTARASRRGTSRLSSVARF